MLQEDKSVMNEKVLVPPFKIQGIKTKLVPFIDEYIKYRQLSNDIKV